MSRGLLRIKSRHAPFRRAAIYFATTATAVDIDVRDLNGERFLLLVRDPALTITVGREDGTFGALPVIDESVTADQAQMMLESIADGLPVREAAEELANAAGDLAPDPAIAAILDRLGIPTVGDALDRLEAASSKLDSQARQLLKLSEDLAEEQTARKAAEAIVERVQAEASKLGYSTVTGFMDQLGVIEERLLERVAVLNLTIDKGRDPDAPVVAWLETQFALSASLAEAGKALEGEVAELKVKLAAKPPAKPKPSPNK